jgi:surface antigen
MLKWEILPSFCLKFNQLFIKKKKLDSKNASIKEDFVKIVFKYVKTLNKEEEEISSSSSSSDEYEESEYDTESDEYEWEYYYA